MQHLDVRAQIAVKQRVLEDSLQHLSKLRAETMFRPIHGPSCQGYRYRARLTVRYVAEEGRRAGRLSRAQEQLCRRHDELRGKLPPHVSAMLVPLRHLVAGLSIRDRMPQIELAVGSEVTALVLRILEPLTDADEALLRTFADDHGVQFWLQPKGPDTVVPVLSAGRGAGLHAAGVRHPHAVQADRFHAGQPPDQSRAGEPGAARCSLPSKTDRVLDLFCGIGNFTLPLARMSREVVGIEGSEVLTARALENAKANGVDAHTSFACRNLFEVTADDLRALGAFDKFLIDPPREGALAVAKALADIAQSGDGAAEAHRVRVVQPRDACPRCRSARPRGAATG